MGFDLSVPPAGWLVGDGAAINRHVYADLDAVKYCGDALNAAATAWYRCRDPANSNATRSITGDYLVTRDLRGVFPRFLDGGRGADAGRILGSQQNDAIRNISGGFYDGNGNLGLSGTGLANSGPFNTTTTSDYCKGIAGSNYGSGTTIMTFDVSRVVPTASENRPVNIALLGCIKY